MAQGNGGEGDGAVPQIPEPSPVLPVVRARRFELVDDGGTVRAVLGTQVGNGAPGFLVSDSTGRPRLALHVTPEDAPAIDVLDEEGSPRIHLGLDAAGSPAVTLFGPSANATQALVSITPDGSALVRLAQADGKTRLFLSIQPDGTPYLSLMDSDGRPKLSLALPGGNPALLMLDRGGRPRAVMSVTSEDGPQFAVMGEEGDMAWTSAGRPGGRAGGNSPSD